ncbi:Rv0340 family IniB-related protein, partial [Mycobacterium sp.]|uniref:Rv0340 family IniB-related protein n=1 Tax=Mycobacterium sp. TaxID=1785 RepID=UPI002D271C62
MANSLLDFVMSLVRDSDAAAAYNANPAQAIADAHLTDVTSADVNSLIPVVSESFSTG